MISTMESPSFKREIISTHIPEYKRLKPKEVDQSEQQNVNSKLQRSKYVYTRILEKTESQPTKRETKITHTNFHKILTNGIPE
jgi:hypothetical protein